MTNHPSEDVKIRRAAERASYDIEDVKAILAEGLVAHVGSIRNGKPVVIPMFYALDGDDLLLHGAPAAGVVRRAAGDNEICVSVTLVDGLVLARSAFHHSMNYRSVVVMGTAEVIEDGPPKSAALDAFVEKIVPNRHAELRPNTAKEVRATSVLRLSLSNASAKIRTGPPVDDEEDYGLDIWAGVVPITTAFGEPEPDPQLRPDVPVPQSISDVYRPIPVEQSPPATGPVV